MATDSYLPRVFIGGIADGQIISIPSRSSTYAASRQIEFPQMYIEPKSHQRRFGLYPEISHYKHTRIASRGIIYDFMLELNTPASALNEFIELAPRDRLRIATADDASSQSKNRLNRRALIYWIATSNPLILADACADLGMDRIEQELRKYVRE